MIFFIKKSRTLPTIFLKGFRISTSSTLNLNVSVSFQALYSSKILSNYPKEILSRTNKFNTCFWRQPILTLDREYLSKIAHISECEKTIVNDVKLTKFCVEDVENRTKIYHVSLIGYDLHFSFCNCEEAKP